jgi:two-component system, NtrC family, response regulator HydG
MAKHASSIRAMVLDEELDIAPDVHSILAGRDAEATLVGSLHEFRQVEEAQGPADRVIVNLGSGLTGWEVARLLRGTGYCGPTLVFHNASTSDGLDHLGAMTNVRCLPRPRDRDSLAVVLDESLHTARPGEWDPPTIRCVAPDIIGQSAQIRDVLARISKVAGGNASVCIGGESGTGKELIARAIHHNSLRRDRPLVTVDCTAVPERLMESHLFGHTRGSFTGAAENRDGVFSLAHTGTLFIDEISALPLPLQAKLLRVVQTREFQKVGGSRPIQTDIRLITASNRDLRRAVEAGTFREDLYYRIAVVTIQIPPLRERREDLPLLVAHFLTKFAAAHRKALRGLTAEAQDLLSGYHWPGNVRQLENCLEQAVVLCEGDTIGVDVLPLADPIPRAEFDPTVRIRPGLTLGAVEQQYILRTLEDTGGNRTRAARILGISLRCLQYKLRAYSEEGVAIPAQPNRGLEPRHLLGV